MKYKIGDIVVYKEELRCYVTSNRYVINSSGVFDNITYYEVKSVDIDLETIRVSAKPFERNTMLDNLI